MPKIESAQVRAKLEKWFLFRQSVLLHDLQAPVIRTVIRTVIRSVADESQAQDAAKAHFAPYFNPSPAQIAIVERRQREIVDVVTNPTWFFEELKN